MNTIFNDYYSDLVFMVAFTERMACFDVCLGAGPDGQCAHLIREWRCGQSQGSGKLIDESLL
jgi:hypothetical protein